MKHKIYFTTAWDLYQEQKIKRAITDLCIQLYGEDNDEYIEKVINLISQLYKTEFFKKNEQTRNKIEVPPFHIQNQKGAENRMKSVNNQCPLCNKWYTLKYVSEDDFNAPKNKGICSECRKKEKLKNQLGEK